MRIKVMLTGRSYHTAQNLPDELDLPDGSTLDDALEAISSQLGDDGAGLAPTCLIAVAGEHLGTVGAHEARPLHDGDELTLIAPVAGG